MTLLAESLCGSRTPTRLRLPAGDLDYSLADEVLSWVDSIGMTLFDWQKDCLRRGLAVSGRKWAAYEVDLVVPRQNGKNELLVALELAAVAVLRKRLVVHSAHEAATAQKHFGRFQELAERLPEVEKLLPATKTQGFYTANGKEHISFRNGAVIDFRTRTRKAGRGFSSDLVVLDEAFELPPAAVGSLMYTLRARKNPQIWKTSSAAHANSNVLHADRKRADADDPNDSRFLYMEWGNDEGTDPSDPAVWARSNPSMGLVAPGFALEPQTFQNEYSSARHDPELLAEFVREICGVPEPPLGEVARIIDPTLWSLLADERSKVASHDAWALAVTPDRKFASIGLAGRRSDGRVHVECVWRQPTAGALEKVVEVWKAKKLPLRIHRSGAEGSFIPPLLEAGVEVVEVTSADVAQATGQFIDAANSDGLRHLDQSSVNKALSGAVLRPQPDGASLWWQRGSSVEISPLVAVTVALGGVPVPVAVDPASQVW